MGKNKAWKVDEECGRRDFYFIHKRKRDSEKEHSMQAEGTASAKCRRRNHVWCMGEITRSGWSGMRGVWWVPGHRVRQGPNYGGLVDHYRDFGFYFA